MRTTLSRRTRATALLAAPVAAALLLSGCSGSDEAAPDPAPSATPSATTSSAAATPTPTPTPSATPTTPAATSPFEDKAPVKAVRKWAVALGKAVDAHDTSMRKLGDTVTADGRKVTAQVVASDLKNRYSWPGPQPLTPVHVSTKGGTSSVDACYLTRGWSIDPATGDRVNSRKVEPASFRLVKDSGKWKVDAVYSGKADCGGVKVAEVLW